MAFLIITLHIFILRLLCRNFLASLAGFLYIISLLIPRYPQSVLYIRKPFVIFFKLLLSNIVRKNKWGRAFSIPPEWPRV